MKNKIDFINNNTILYLIPLVFFILISARIIFSYHETKEQEYDFAKKEAQLLNKFSTVHRDYYQQFFIDKIIPLNKDTLKALPAYSSSKISQTFSENNSFNIEVRTVSNRVRNPKNIVDKYELKAMNYLSEHKHAVEFFSDKPEDFYQYGYALRIEKKCLACHGKREDAPEFIRQRYSTAYDYKLGDIRGIVSIKVPKDSVHQYFLKYFVFSSLYDILILLVIFVFVFLFFKKSKSVNKILKELITEKTEELTSNNNFLQSYITALDNSSALTKTNPSGVIIYANDKFLKDTGYTREEVIGKTHKIIRHPQTPKAVFKDMWQTVLRNENWNGIIKGLRKDKTEFVTKMSIIPVLDEKGEIVEFISPRTDITELVKTKEHIENLLVTDTLTQLPNRQKLIETLRKDQNVAHLALLNIDRFKDINDFYGHSIADKVLIDVAWKLKSICQNEKTDVYKLPSDEFAIYTSMDVSDEEFVSHIQNLVKQVIETKFEIEEYNIFVTLSCGIASNVSAIMVKADMALQVAKEKKEYLVVYDESLNMAQNITKNIQGIKLLKNAIEHNQITPYFQPIYNIKTNKVEKFECLARIIRDNGDVVAPFHFLDIAIKSKLYPEITHSIVNKSFEFFKDKSYEFSINISMEDILNHKTVSFILTKLSTYNNASNVVFEILESQEVQDYEEVKEFISMVKQYGCKVAIDDFGSGYSNFTHLHKLNIDYLKIDASLVRYITSDENSRKITQNIINFAKDMNLRTIAEFVEDKESLVMLEEMGADYIQGYYIGKPEKGIDEKFGKK